MLFLIILKSGCRVFLQSLLIAMTLFMSRAVLYVEVSDYLVGDATAKHFGAKLESKPRAN